MYSYQVPVTQFIQPEVVAGLRYSREVIVVKPSFTALYNSRQFTEDPHIHLFFFTTQLSQRNITWHYKLELVTGCDLILYQTTKF